MKNPDFTYINTPIIIEIFPTLQCNVHCTYCDRGEEESEIADFSQCRVLLENVQKDPLFALKSFRLSGREPLLHPLINELIDYLHLLVPEKRVELFSNGLRVDTLTEDSLGKITLAISVYTYTQKQLSRNAVLHAIVTQKKCPLAVVDVDHHELLSPPGTVRNNFNPFTFCFSPTLLCDTKKVYPCCRAHLFEQMYETNYHYAVDTPDLFQKLIALIQNTDMCSHCPRIYKDNTIVPCAQGKNPASPQL